MTMTASTVELAQAYEALRAQAIGQTPTVTPRGLALVRRAGLAAWMPAHAPLSAAAPAAHPRDAGPRTPRVAVDAELVRLLTEMALGGHRGSDA
jgi:hypothetical protein